METEMYGIFVYFIFGEKNFALEVDDPKNFRAYEYNFYEIVKLLDGGIELFSAGKKVDHDALAKYCVRRMKMGLWPIDGFDVFHIPYRAISAASNLQRYNYVSVASDTDWGFYKDGYIAMKKLYKAHLELNPEDIEFVYYLGAFRGFAELVQEQKIILPENLYRKFIKDLIEYEMIDGVELKDILTIEQMREIIDGFINAD